MAVTVWSGRHEVFAEYDVPVAGEHSHFVTHVSDIARGTPRTAGPVTYRLVPATGATVDVLDEQPARDGIYLTDVTWPTAGAWRVSLRVPTEAGVDDIDLGEVTVYGTDVERDAAPEPDELEGIALLKEQQWLLGTKTDLVARHTVEERVTVPARIRAAPHLAADVVPPMAGLLAPVDGGSLPVLGTRVEAGQLLAWVTPPISEALISAIAARAELARLEVAVEKTEATLVRVRALHESQARSARELEEAEFAALAARAEWDGARAALAAFAAAGIGTDGGGGPPRFAMRAPLEGVVDAVHAVAGQSVGADAPILRLIDPGTVHVEAQVRAEHLGRLHLDGVVRLALAAQGQASVQLAPDEVQLVHEGLTVDEHTGRVPVIFAVDNAELRWRPGLAVDVSLTTGRSEEALAVPRSALLVEDVSTVAYVQLGGETFERRVVTTGLVDGDLVEVLSGLEPGDRVVVDGAYAVRLASVSTTDVGHGHAH